MRKFIIFTFFLVLVLITRIFFIEPKHNPSGAMAPTLLAGDYLLVFKWPFGNFGIAGLNFGSAEDFPAHEKINSGDIITFRYPKKPSVVFIKRVVALPGDRLSYHDGKLFINDKPLKTVFDKDNLYIDRVLGVIKVQEFLETNKSRTYRIQKNIIDNSSSQEILKDRIVPDGRIFVLGDNRNLSNDSRHFGFVPVAAVTGKVIWSYFSYDSIKQQVRWDRIGKRVE